MGTKAAGECYRPHMANQRVGMVKWQGEIGTFAWFCSCTRRIDIMAWCSSSILWTAVLPN